MNERLLNYALLVVLFIVLLGGLGVSIWLLVK